SRIAAEGQKDGERNIPEMGSYTPAPFEQALISNGEQAVQQIFKAASSRISKLRPVVEAYQRQLDELQRRIRPIAEAYKVRSAEGNQMAYALLALNGLVFFAATVAS